MIDIGYFARSRYPNASYTSAFEDDAFGGPGGVPVYRFGMIGYGNAGGVVGCGGQAITRLLGPYSTFAGVHGTARDFTGVAGTSVNRVGVYGQVEDGVPVLSDIHAGVLGAATSQQGVVGYSLQGDGVQGMASGDGAGVSGSSLTGSGVVGESSGYGVYGFSDNAAAVVGEAGPAAYAGVFFGEVAVNGVLTAAVKNAAVPFPDGTQRVLHCMESPEHWFEDFGAAKLKRGRALVKLDADFANVIKRGDYHVFLTARGDCRGLYVRRQGGAEFEVGELAGGTSNVAFSYRIVGRRKDIRNHRRFAKMDALPTPAPPRRRPAPTRAAFIADLERRARARATPAMRTSDREVAAMPPAILNPRRRRAAAQ